ncbi:MAG: dihydrofolate reductase, partial [Bacteroidales bacterium]|nr:dihydrofolate reductase [Bacteroidales bacterium]
MRNFIKVMLTAAMIVTCSCQQGTEQKSTIEEEFQYSVDRFADLQILRYQVPGFENLSLQQKQLLYHLSEAGLMGRDILFDQNNRYNLAIRKVLEAIYTSYSGDKGSANFKALETYLKRVWFSNGIHHHYSTDKFKPEFSEQFFVDCVKALNPSQVPVREGQTVDEWLKEITPVIFDENVMAKRVVQSGDGDLIAASANNYYGDGVTQEEVEKFYNNLKDPKDETPVSYGLNSRIVKENGTVKELVWKVGGLYTEAIEKIVDELNKAKSFAENDKQRAVIESLIEFYKTGDLKTYDEYSILWVEDLDSEVDFVNGFTETY